MIEHLFFKKRNIKKLNTRSKKIRRYNTSFFKNHHDYHEDSHYPPLLLDVMNKFAKKNFG